ncbi:MAG TPA: xanthine dehydrogenase family protein subunit M [Kofleriaceae bacterium]|jgi:xanthine dehydrogenase YagS FAD-binding subunit
MHPFTYLRASSLDEAVAAGAAPHAAYIAGGTTIVDLMRLNVMAPATVVDIAHLPLAEITESAAGGLRIGSLARNTDVAVHPAVATRFPALAEALLAGASPQLRNMATTGGNLLQRTRCAYFRDGVSACNKRAPGSGCAAIGGYARMHAVLGGSAQCIAAHPSDMCVALVALDAIVHVRGASGERTVPIDEFHLPPGDHPERENVLAPGELVVAIELPATALAKHSRYTKVRDRASFAFALASAAAAIDVAGGKIRDARVALGGVGTIPWRSRAAEHALVGEPPSPEAFRAAAEAALADAKPAPDNAFKVELAKRAIVRALHLSGGAA